MNQLNKNNFAETKDQFLRFIVIGLLSTVINYAVFYVLYQYSGIYYLIASALGFFSGVIVGYGFNKNWTFSAQGASKKYIYKYYAVYTVSLILGLVFLKVLVNGFGVLPELANFLTIILTTCTNFIGTKLWVFEK